MSRNSGVLTMTDLKPDSEQALVLAGRIAERCDLRLDVLYALGLRGLLLRDAVPELQELDQRITFIDRSVRSLIRAHFPDWDSVPGPVIDVDRGPVALGRRVAQLEPPIVALPSSRSAIRDDGQCGFAAIATISAPVVLVSSTNGSCKERALLITAETTPSHALVRLADEWLLWFQAVSSDSVIPGEPGLDVLVMEGASQERAIADLTALERPIVLVPKSVMDGPMSSVMRAAVASFLKVQPSHVLIMPDASPPPLRPEFQFDLSLVAAGA